jgi:hypothetical protein
MGKNTMIHDRQLIIQVAKNGKVRIHLSPGPVPTAAEGLRVRIRVDAVGTYNTYDVERFLLSSLQDAGYGFMAFLYPNVTPASVREGMFEVDLGLLRQQVPELQDIEWLEGRIPVLLGGGAEGTYWGPTATGPDHISAHPVLFPPDTANGLFFSSPKVHRMRNYAAIKVLFLAANPTDTARLRMDEEIRSIDQVLCQSRFRDRFEIRQHWAVRVTDIQSYLLRHKPDIVHFSGHGSASGEIVLEDDSGASHPVSVQALSRLFSILRDNIKCVVLNACYSEKQAQAIAEHVDCVVGMSKAIGDSAAISFAAAFYQALGYGRDVRTAFELGCNQIDLASLSQEDVPKLLAVRGDPERTAFIHSG